MMTCAGQPELPSDFTRFGGGGTDLPGMLTGTRHFFPRFRTPSTEPRDLMTGRHIPEHATKVADHAAAQATILGKAITALTRVKGWCSFLCHSSRTMRRQRQ